MAKKEETYKALEEQIGNAGADPIQQPLGKLQHAAAYGQQEKLNEDEKASMDAFLARERRLKEADEAADRYASKLEDDSPITDGWIPVDRAKLKQRDRFYPTNWEFYIRPATVQAIKGWLGIDDKNALQMNNTFDEIIKQCVRIKCDGETIHWSRINFWDRFWFIVLVREATFASNKKTIEFQDYCSECDEEITFELRSDTLFYDFPDNDLIEEYWDPEEMKWTIDPTKYGLEDESEINLWTPTIGKQQAIVSWAQRQVNRGVKLSDAQETFVTMFLPWLINKVAKDNNTFDRQVAKLYKEYKEWSVDKQTFMNDVIKNITINAHETLKQTCPHCGEEVVSNIQFPNGVKVLFEVETKVQKFGSR